MSSQHIAGLHSRYAHFNPPQYSHSTIKDSGVIYAIDGVLELKRSQKNGGVQDGPPSGTSEAAPWLLNESMTKELLGLPWFGGTGGSVSRVGTCTTTYDCSSAGMLMGCR